MDFLTISDIAERSGLPKPTIYRMFNELSDLIPHKRIGRKILFPEEAVARVIEIRQRTTEEGFTYRMVREEALGSSSTDAKAENKTEDIEPAPPTSDLSQALSQSISASFEGLREDLRLLAAQIDRQNDLLSRLIGQSQTIEELPPSIADNEIRADSRQVRDENGKLVSSQVNSENQRDSGEQKSGLYRIKWSNFWAGKGWKA